MKNLFLSLILMMAVVCQVNAQSNSESYILFKGYPYLVTLSLDGDIIEVLRTAPEVMRGYSWDSNAPMPIPIGPYVKAPKSAIALEEYISPLNNTVIGDIVILDIDAKRMKELHDGIPEEDVIVLNYQDKEEKEVIVEEELEDVAIEEPAKVVESVDIPAEIVEEEMFEVEAPRDVEKAKTEMETSIVDEVEKQEIKTTVVDEVEKREMKTSIVDEVEKREMKTVIVHEEKTEVIADPYSFNLEFQSFLARLTPNLYNTLKAISVLHIANPSQKIEITSFITKGADKNTELAINRMEACRNQLITYGIPEDLITTSIQPYKSSNTGHVNIRLVDEK